jgi:L-serine dehydratase
MGLPSVFEAFQLAVGPSTVFTTGALLIGQAFRESILSSPFRSNHRILIELIGNFSKLGRENKSDQAVIAGLGGYRLEEPGMKMQSFYLKIKENGYFQVPGGLWPFNPESDLIFNDTGKPRMFENCIRFHLLSEAGQPAYQAEYFSLSNGLIKGNGVQDPVSFSVDDFPKSFLEIKDMITIGKIALLEFVISGECSKHRISRDHFHRRMHTTWKLMKANIDRGLTAKRVFLNTININPTASSEHTRASFYALALTEEILNNSTVITAPTCTGSAILPAVFRHIQEKFLFPDEKMVEGLIISGLFGSLILHQLNESKRLVNWLTEVAFSAIMAAAGASYLLGGSPDDIEKAATMAAILYGGSNQKTSKMDSDSLLLLNSMVAQTLPSLIDFSKIQSGYGIPEFDHALRDLFTR